VLYWVIKGVLTPVLRTGYRIHVEGKEHIPRDGAAIIAANHRSFLDSIFLPLVVRRRVTFVAKAEYFDDPKTAWFFRGVGQIPIRREGGSAGELALEAAMGVLREGGIFGIYPEGTRTRDGYMHRGHTGIARIALRSGAPIIPVGLIGTDDVQPTDKKVPRLFKRVAIRFGEPISTDRYREQAADHLALRELTDEVMYEIAQLSGYEYVDTYATRRAEDVPTEVAHVATYEDAGAVRALEAAAS
jgi:1-acyl-sn-glycerol-3-phosphate acyltransferase